MELADYVITITNNINRFPDFGFKQINDQGAITQVYIQRQDSLTNWVREQAKQIYILAYTANEINVKKHPELKEERLRKQARAIELCGEHLAAIQLCRKHFHLSSKRVYYWGSKTVETRSLIERWHESDKSRY